MGGAEGAGNCVRALATRGRHSSSSARPGRCTLPAGGRCEPGAPGTRGPAALGGELLPPRVKGPPEGLGGTCPICWVRWLGGRWPGNGQPQGGQAASQRLLRSPGRPRKALGCGLHPQPRSTAACPSPAPGKCCRLGGRREVTFRSQSPGPLADHTGGRPRGFVEGEKTPLSRASGWLLTSSAHPCGPLSTSSRTVLSHPGLDSHFVPAPEKVRRMEGTPSRHLPCSSCGDSTGGHRPAPFQ